MMRGPVLRAEPGYWRARLRTAVVDLPYQYQAPIIPTEQRWSGEEWDICVEDDVCGALRNRVGCGGCGVALTNGKADALIGACDGCNACVVGHLG